MNAKTLIFTIAALVFVSTCSAGVVPVAAAYVAPYASSYNSHVVNHAVAAPLVSAPLTAAYPYAAAYSAYSYPYTAAYSAPIVALK